MSQNQNAEKQRKFIAAKKASGLLRLVLWARPDDVEALKLAARQPHSLSELRRKIEQELRKELEPAIRNRVKRELYLKTKRAMMLQKRTEARQRPIGANRPPECIRFEKAPPAARRNALKAAGWLYDPVAVIWHLPDDPASYAASERLLSALAEFGVSRLAKPEEDLPTSCGPLGGTCG
jgi:hypothetical protein